MSLKISTPNGPVSSGDIVCLTITGVTTPPPDVRVKFGSGAWEPIDVMSLGGGIYVVCCTVPTPSGTLRVAAADGTGACGTAVAIPVRP